MLKKNQVKNHQLRIQSPSLPQDGGVSNYVFPSAARKVVRFHETRTILRKGEPGFLGLDHELTINWWFGLVWIFGIPLCKGLFLMGTPRIPNNQPKPLADWRTPKLFANTKNFGLFTQLRLLGFLQLSKGGGIFQLQTKCCF